MKPKTSTREVERAERDRVLARLLMEARVQAQELRGSFIMPAQRDKPWPPIDFIKEFPDVAQAAVSARYGVKGLLVLNGRLLRPNNKLRLWEIGIKLNVTREWVRIVENQILSMFAQIFFLDHYVTSKFRIREEFLFPLRDLEEKIRSFRYGTFTLADWARCLQRVWCVHPRDLGPIEPLVRGILNYPVLPDSNLAKIPRFNDGGQGESVRSRRLTARARD